MPRYHGSGWRTTPAPDVSPSGRMPFDLLIHGGLPVDGTAAAARPADVGVLDPATVIDAATDSAPARYPLGIADVIVGGAAAVLGGAETGRLTRGRG